MNQITNNANDLLNQLTGKEVVQKISEHFTDEIANGNINPLRFHVQAKMLIKALENVLDSTLDETLLERAKYGKDAELLGAVVTEVDSGVKYDYDSTGDLEYTHIKAAYENILKQKKAREKWLQQMTKSENVCDVDGVFHTINPPVKTSKTTIKVNFK